jgi:hypothetical protein
LPSSLIKNPGSKIEPGNWHGYELYESMDDLAQICKFHRPRGVLKTDPKAHTAVGIAETTGVEIRRNARWSITWSTGALMARVVHVAVDVHWMVPVTWIMGTVCGWTGRPVNDAMSAVNNRPSRSDTMIGLDTMAVRGRSMSSFLCTGDLGHTQTD